VNRTERFTRGASWGTATRRIALLGVAALGVLPFAGSALSAVCHVPAAVLCEGCAESLSVRIARNGSCRISFTPAPAAGNVGSGKFVDIDIEAEPHRALLHRSNEVRPPVTNRPVPLRASAACFVFNGRRFCE
jgi:hypothetical protein